MIPKSIRNNTKIRQATTGTTKQELYIPVTVMLFDRFIIAVWILSEQQAIPISALRRRTGRSGTAR
jgi:hypothetical protein